MTSPTSIFALDRTLDDEALASQARQDAAAFTELYQRHFQRVYRYHMAHTANVEDAQDLTAQTFMAALEGIASYRGKGSFCAWLFGIARRKRAMRFRSRRFEVPLEHPNEVADPAPPPEIAAGRRLQLAQVSHALSQISPDRAEALMLCLFGDLTATEAGQVMGKSEAAVKMLLHRGLRDLRERCAPGSQEEE